ncbi:metallophosphoesterase [Streptomyces sp. LP05-1]|uniref:Metallophosphoesterase n=1 Tax=Streptomyces pyxinae TaxID=2970734 RepID=A0ABT2CIX7_9ACTN|nr:metallophosphoesterase [Streptomyces sp. LP05-1]MCS0637052.1 metallophosphoesterase [Streptomyces sp. LP05-1]
MVVVLALLGAVHWYVWRRLVRDVTRPGGAVRRIGAGVLVLLPLLSVGALVAGRAGAPFWLERILAWPGYLWLALLLYLVLALLVGEAVRPLLLRLLPAASGAGAPPATDAPEPEAAPAAEAAAPEAPGPEAPPIPVAPSGSAAPPATDAPEPEAAPAAEAAAPEAAEAVAPDARPTPPPARPAPVRTASAGTAPDPAVGPAAGSPGAAGSASGAGPADVPRRNGPVSRRLFVSRIVGGTAAAAAVGTVAHGAHGVLRGPRLKRITVPLAKLPRAAHGYRIAVVSDIHLGPILGRAHTQRIVDTINGAQPDLVAVVGDLVDGSVADLGPAAEPLARLEARHGSFFVTGNHEYFSGAAQWVDHVRELGLRPLENQRVELPGFDLAGVNDVAGESEGQGPDFAAALGDRDRARTAVLLAHQPIVIDEAVRHGVDLQLSGHTHGGQLWPGNYLAELANPTVAGLERYGDTQLYVSRGAGAWGPPVRVGAPSDITLVQLASRQA